MPYLIGKNPKDIIALDSDVKDPISLYKSVTSF